MSDPYFGCVLVAFCQLLWSRKFCCFREIELETGGGPERNVDGSSRQLWFINRDRLQVSGLIVCVTLFIQGTDWGSQLLANLIDTVERGAAEVDLIYHHWGGAFLY
jgi:hypothetical protein